MDMKDIIVVKVHNGLRYEEYYSKEDDAYYVLVSDKDGRFIEEREYDTDDEAWNFIIERTM